MFEKIKLEGECYFDDVRDSMKGTSLTLKVQNKVRHINIRNAAIQLIPKDENSRQFLIEMIREYCNKTGHKIEGSVSSFSVPFQLRLYE